MGKTTRKEPQGCGPFWNFFRINNSKSKVESTEVGSLRGKIPDEDLSSENLQELNTTKANAAGRRLRSDSPIEDGVFESQPLKRQNSMGEVEPPQMGSNTRSNPASPPPSHVTSATTLQQQQQQNADTTGNQRPASRVEKSSTFPPRKADGCTRKSHDIQQITSRTGPTPNYSECPPYGSKSVIGRRAKMEDAFKAVPNLMQVPLHREADELLPPRLAPQLRTTSSSSRCSAETAAAAAAAAAGVPQTVIPAVPAISGSETQQAGSITTSGSAFTAQIGPGGLTICPPDQSSVEVLHFFGVFDGHGGADAAMHCAKTLHERVKEALSSVTSPSGGSGNRGTPSPTEIQTQQEAVGKQEEKFSLRGSAAAAEAQVAEEGGVEGSSTSHTVATDIPLSSTFESGSSDIDFMDAVDLEASEGGGNEVDPNGGMLRADGAGRLRHAASIEGLPCTTETVEAALTKAFHLTDEEFGEMGGYEHLALVGTTAVVALIGGRMIYVANCGDSRAVLCRDGQAIPLSDDHKAAREDETARVEAAGGQILFWNGVRVMGLLAVSRAIGDHSLRPYVIAEPEVTIVNRYPDDEVLIMASDGLWDVMSNQEACNLAKKCLLRARQRGSTRHSAAKVAATVLTRAAVDRGSRDNVTVVIVDLTLEGEGLQGKRDEISVPLPLKPSLRSSDGIEIENLPCSTIWDTKVPLNGSSGNDGSNEEEMPGAPAPDATPAAPQSPFDVPMPSEGTAGAPLTAVTIEGNPQQQAIHPRGSIPMTSPFSTD